MPPLYLRIKHDFSEEKKKWECTFSANWIYTKKIFPVEKEKKNQHSFSFIIFTTIGDEYHNPWLFFVQILERNSSTALSLSFFSSKSTTVPFEKNSSFVSLKLTPLRPFSFSWFCHGTKLLKRRKKNLAATLHTYKLHAILYAQIYISVCSIYI